MKRLALWMLGIVVVFAIALMLFFPTDAVARWALDRLPLTNGERVVFTSARLGARGVRLERVALLNAEGESRLAADWLRFRPSLWGLVRGRLGSPWTMGLGVFGGTIEGTLAHDGTAGSIDLAWDDLEIGTWVPLLARRTKVAGHLSGTATMTLRGTAPVTGKGSAALRAAQWTPGTDFLDGATVRADTADIGWTLASQRIVFETIAVTGSDFAVQGQGNIKLASALPSSVLDIRLDVTPQKGLHPRVRQVFDGATGVGPGAVGARKIIISGTLNEPRVRTP